MSDGGVSADPPPKFLMPMETQPPMQQQQRGQLDQEEAAADVAQAVGEEGNEDVGIKGTQKKEKTEGVKKTTTAEPSSKDGISKAENDDNAVRYLSKMEPGKPMLQPAELNKVINNISLKDVNSALVQQIKAWALAAVGDEKAHTDMASSDEYAWFAAMRSENAAANSQIAKNKLEEMREALAKAKTIGTIMNIVMAITIAVAMGPILIFMAPIALPLVVMVGTGGMDDGGMVEQLFGMMGIDDPMVAKLIFAVVVSAFTGGVTTFALLMIHAAVIEETRFKERSPMDGYVHSGVAEGLPPGVEEELKAQLGEEKAEIAAYYLQVITMLLGILGQMGKEMAASGSLPEGVMEGGQISPEIGQEMLDKAMAEMERLGCPVNLQDHPQFAQLLKDHVGDMTRMGMAQWDEVDAQVESALKAEKSLGHLEMSDGNDFKYQQPVGA